MKFAVTCSIVLYKYEASVRNTVANFLETSLTVKLYLIDNSPTDDLRYRLGDLIGDARIVYIFNNKNIGYGAAHNIAIRESIDSTQYHLVLNPDVSFKQGVLEELINYLDKNEDVGLVIPKVFYPDGRLQYVCKLLPAPIDLISRRFLPGIFFKRRIERFEMRQMQFNEEFEAPYIHGCFMFLRTEALQKVGLFDERFFLYPEDIDLTRRIHKEYKTMFYPKVSIVHEHQKGSYKNIKLLYIHILNMVRYFNKWGWIFDKERKKINKRILSQFK